MTLSRLETKTFLSPFQSMSNQKIWVNHTEIDCSDLKNPPQSKKIKDKDDNELTVIRHNETAATVKGAVPVWTKVVQGSVITKIAAVSTGWEPDPSKSEKENIEALLIAFQK